MQTKYSPSTGGFYVEGMHQEQDIPADAVDITPEEHQAVLLAAQATPGGLIGMEEGRPVAVDAPPPTVEALRAAKQAQIRDGAEAVLAPLKAEYGPTEIASWDQQYEEANALEANPDAPAPLVRAIAAARGMDAAALAARIRANRAAWVAISGHVVGQRLAYQDALDAAAALPDEDEARAAITAIVPVYTLPEAANA